MSSVTPPKSDRFQTLTAVLFMGLFAAAFLAFVSTKDRIVNLACNQPVFAGICPDEASPESIGSSVELVNSQITVACVDSQGLKISVLLAAPLSGASSIQIFTTGEDVFPSERGMEDSFKMGKDIPGSIDQLDFVIPVESMPVGEHIFGNIIISQNGLVVSYAAYFVQVSECSSDGMFPSNPTLIMDEKNGPSTYSASCLSDNRLMLAFEFDEPVFGQYRALIAGIPYQLSSVGNQPAVLFFTGDAPAQETISIQLVSATSQKVLLEETFTPPTCGS